MTHTLALHLQPIAAKLLQDRELVFVESDEPLILHPGELSGQRTPIDAEIDRQSASVKRQSDGAGTVWLLVHGK